MRWVTCTKCEDKMRRQLRHLPEDAAHVQAELYDWRTEPGGSRTSDPAMGALPGGTDLLSASAALTGRAGPAYDQLASWEACWREERLLTARERPATLWEVCNGLSTHLTWACRNFLAIDEFAQELSAAVKITRDVLSDERTQVRLGRFRCPNTLPTLEDEEPKPCGGQLWRDHSDDLHPAIFCRACGARWEREAWDLLGDVFKVAVSTSQAASFLGVSERTVRRWVTEGKVPNYGTPERMRILVSDLSTVGRAA